MLKISIPRPCHQDWDEMLPQQQGRFCNSCAKTVVDFTVMNDEEVKNYFIQNAGGKTCGRFIDTQLHRITIHLPENFLSMPMPFWKRFLAASLVIFSTTLFSCNTNYDTTTGLILSQQRQMGNDTTPVKVDPETFVGKAILRDTLPVKKPCTQTMGIIAPPPMKLMGDVTMVTQKQDTQMKKKVEPIVGTSVLVNPKMLTGEIVMVNQKKDTAKIKKDTNIIVGKPSIEPCDKNIYQ